MKWSLFIVNALKIDLSKEIFWKKFVYSKDSELIWKQKEKQKQ